jgi:hypothetical protein
LDQILSRYPTLEKDHNVLAVHEYWINKRYKKGVPLLRILQVFFDFIPSPNINTKLEPSQRLPSIVCIS